MGFSDELLKIRCYTEFMCEYKQWNGNFSSEVLETNLLVQDLIYESYTLQAIGSKHFNEFLNS